MWAAQQSKTPRRVPDGSPYGCRRAAHGRSGCRSCASRWAPSPRLYSRGLFSPWKYLLAAVAAMALQAGANMVNDYYDFVSGTDSPDWQAPENFGPGLVIQRGFLKPDAVFMGGIVAFVIGIALGIILVALCGWPILWLGLIGVFGLLLLHRCAAEPRLSRVGRFHGLRPDGSGLRAWRLLRSDLVLSRGARSLLRSRSGYSARAFCRRTICAISTTTQRTASARWRCIIGRNAAVKEFRLSNLFAYLTVLIGVLIGQFPWLALAVAITAPHALEEIRLVSEGPDAERHNRAMALSGQLQFEFGAVLVAAFLLRYLL